MSIISCKNICLAYDGKPVVNNLSFEVTGGDCVCVVGENGSGKSTLFKALLGLMKPVSGTIKFGDGLKQSEIGYLPQQTAIQRDFPASVGEVVLSGCINKMGHAPFYSLKEKKLASDNMKRLGIFELRKKCYKELSGGQQQRVLLARALCATSKLILLDEPVAGLDPVVTADFYRLISQINREDGITVIMISHDIQAAVKNATHILHMHRGAEFFGKTEDYLKSDIATGFIGGTQQ